MKLFRFNWRKGMGVIIALYVSILVMDELAYEIWVKKAESRELNLVDRIQALTSPHWIFRLMKNKRAVQMNCPECNKPIQKENINGIFYHCVCGFVDDTTWFILKEYPGVFDDETDKRVVD